MKLLILTQKVDKEDDILGSFHRWIEEFAKKYEKVTVIALEKGTYDLPRNVEVVSLGKERGVNSRGMRALRFYILILSRLGSYDRVFVHMNPEYVVLGGVIWRLLGKRVGLWYTHRAVNLKLKVAEKLSNVIFTAATESFQYPSKKLHVLGHGIDTERFTCSPKNWQEIIRIVSIGRITKIKRPDVLIEAGDLLRQAGQRFSITLVGGATSREDVHYERNMQALMYALDLQEEVRFAGSLPNTQLHRIYCDADLTVNMVPTGGLDKAVIESMSAGRIVLTSNEAFRPHFGSYADALIFEYGNAEDLARKIRALRERNDKQEIATFLAQVAREKFTVEALVDKLVALL